MITKAVDSDRKETTSQIHGEKIKGVINRREDTIILLESGWGIYFEISDRVRMNAGCGIYPKEKIIGILEDLKSDKEKLICELIKMLELAGEQS